MALSKYIMQPIVNRDVQRYASAELQKIEKSIASIIADSAELRDLITAGGGGGDISTEILADNPTGYWKCDEASGDFADSSGAGNTLVAAGTIRYQQVSLIKHTPTVMHAFFTSGAGATIAGSLGLAVPFTGDYTIEAIALFPSSISSASIFAMGNTLESEAQNFQCLFYRNGADTLTAFWESGSGVNRSTELAADISMPGPYHLAIVKDGTANTVTFFINGLQYGDPVAYTNEPTGGTSVITGIGAVPGQASSGVVLGHVAFYSGIKLSAERIRIHARAAGY